MPFSPLSKFNVLTARPVDNQNGLMGWWTFDAGAATDGSGNQNNGTLTNGPTPLQGMPRQALKFTRASSQHVLISDQASLNLALNFSIMAWIKVTTLGNFQTIFDPATVGATQRWIFQLDNTNHIDLAKRTISDNLSSGTIDTNWRHVAATKSGDSGANVAFYIDGAPSGTATFGSVTTPSGAKRIGGGTENSSYFDGLIDDVRLYNRALSAAEIRAIYSDAFMSAGEGELPMLKPAAGFFSRYYYDMARAA